MLKYKKGKGKKNIGYTQTNKGVKLNFVNKIAFT